MDPDQDRLTFLKNYLLQREKGLDAALLPLGHPGGKDVLVFGCGKGSEILWCATHKARTTLGVDLHPIDTGALSSLLHERGQDDFNYAMAQIDVHDLALSRPAQFDLILSNGVFEHVSDMKGVLNAFRALLRPGGRISIYADGLWFSSIGGHLGRDNWEHLWMSESDIRQNFPARWPAYKSHLNRMTCVDFMNAVRDVGALVLQFRIRSDPYLKRMPMLIDKMRAKQELSPTDLSITSIACELCFIEHL
ncbi:class I SAM-dependent methyltransferase [Aquabacterium sp.]|uniref:class I SAM-dependent methyltransferase n=1 Tax=Aquabacterium sp. TaxID=1872578 RepID=UPI002CB5FD75|nr:methyltransferase [Aquabacterium sp.]HSW05528.1 methyltransferase [Aquabacterium sp.]